MNTENRVHQMKTIQDEALKLFTKKNIDYGDAFATYGTIGVLIRINEKVQRAMSITSNGITLLNNVRNSRWKDPGVIHIERCKLLTITTIVTSDSLLPTLSTRLTITFVTATNCHFGKPLGTTLVP